MLIGFHPIKDWLVAQFPSLTFLGLKLYYQEYHSYLIGFFEAVFVTCVKMRVQTLLALITTPLFPVGFTLDVLWIGPVRVLNVLCLGSIIPLNLPSQIDNDHPVF